MDVATFATVIGTVFAVAAILIILVSRTLTGRVKRDLVALVLIWVGTLLLVLVAIPEAIPIFLADDSGRVFTTDDGAMLIAETDTSPIRHYFWYAGPAMAAISAGMFLQGWSIWKAD